MKLQPEAAYRLRRLTEADLFSVIECEEQVFAADTWSEAMLTEELSRPDRLYLGAVETSASQRLCGYAGLRIGIDTDLMTIGVVPTWRGQGIAGALLGTLIEVAAQICFTHPNHWYVAADAGEDVGAVLDQCHRADSPGAVKPGEIARAERRIERILLEVRVSNEVAQRLYRAHQFAEVARVRHYYSNPAEDAVVMQRLLR